MTDDLHEKADQGFTNKDTAEYCSHIMTQRIVEKLERHDLSLDEKSDVYEYLSDCLEKGVEE